MKKVYGLMKKVGEWLTDFGADRLLHLLCGLLLAFFTAMLVYHNADGNKVSAVGFSMLVTVIVGFLKEVADQNYEGESDGKDWLFTVIGGVIGAALWLM